jgi:hypothetical protein
MRVSVTHWRDGGFEGGFMVEGKITQNLDGSESCELVFPKPLKVLKGEIVRLTYYMSE